MVTKSCPSLELGCHPDLNLGRDVLLVKGASGTARSDDHSTTAVTRAVAP